MSFYHNIRSAIWRQGEDFKLVFQVGTTEVPLSKNDRGCNANLNPPFTPPPLRLPDASFGQFCVLGTVEATESEELFYFKKKRFWLILVSLIWLDNLKCWWWLICLFLSKHVVKILNMLHTHSEWQRTQSKFQKAWNFYVADSEGHCVCVCFTIH